MLSSRRGDLDRSACPTTPSDRSAIPFTELRTGRTRRAKNPTRNPLYARSTRSLQAGRRISAGTRRGFPQRGGLQLIDEDIKALDDAPDMGLADAVGLLDADFDYQPTDEVHASPKAFGASKG